jgi:hypothetical protein
MLLLAPGRLGTSWDSFTETWENFALSQCAHEESLRILEGLPDDIRQNPFEGFLPEAVCRCTISAAELIALDESWRLTFFLLVAAFPTGSPLLANRTMNVVLVRAGFAHGFKAPVGGGGSHQVGMLLMKVAKGRVGRLAAKRGAMELHKGSRHIESP